MAARAGTAVERPDPHTGFAVREDLCTGCGMCVVACAAIKQEVFSFSSRHAFVEITPREATGSFAVTFTGDCDGCTYCLQFCGFDAIAKPDGWRPAPHLMEVRRRHGERKRATRTR